MPDLKRVSSVSANRLAVLLLAVAGVGCDRAPSLPAKDRSTIGPQLVGHALRDAPRPDAPVETAEATQAGWPGIYGPTSNSQTSERDLNLDWPPAGPPLAWRKNIGTGYSSPVAVGERVIIFHRQGDEEIIECLDLERGDSRWRYAYPTAYQCPYHYSSGPYSTPAIAGDHVYAFGAEGTLRCLQLATGQMVWERALNADYQAKLGDFPVASSPVVDEDRLIVHVGGGARKAGVVALDRFTGRTLWTASADGPSDASPVIAALHGRRYAFVLTDANLAAFDSRTGALHWETPLAPKNREMWNNATTPVVTGGRVFASMFGAGSLCVEQQADGTPRMLWNEFRSLNCQFHNLLPYGAHVYGFAGSEDALWCLETATGKVLWKLPAERGRGLSLAVGSRLIVLFEDGYLGQTELSPQRGAWTYLSEQPVLPKKCVTSPALCQGRLLLRNEADLAAFDLRR